jgi:ribosomal protein S18 acetylase RimI-like enzyme
MMNMRSNCVICAATQDDFEDIQYLFKKLFEIHSVDQNVDYHYTEPGIDYLHRSIDNGITLVAKCGKAVVGFISGGTVDALPFKSFRKQALIRDLFVSNEFRRQGLGKALVQKFTDICRKMGIDHITTDSEDTEQLRSFYKSLGFRVTGVIYEMRK